MCINFGYSVVVLPTLCQKGTLIFKFIPVSESIKPFLRIFSLNLFFAVVFLFGVSSVSMAAPDGKAIFQSNCASCHHPLKDATGPALKGADKKAPSKEWLVKWVHNSAALIAAGDPYAVQIFNEWNKVPMTPFPQLSEEEIFAIFDYVNSVEPPSAATAAAGAEGQAAPESDNWLYITITFSLLLLVLILWKANDGLKRAANEKEGIPNVKEVPLYRNKVVIAMAAILVFIFAGYWLVNGAVDLGRQQNYMPEQPIFYSHKVHAGINQINCLYCHAGAEKGRHAMIPSTNMCMNCHIQIDEYTGEELRTAEGKIVDGTAEIQKLYRYAGWNPETKSYNRDEEGNILATPVQWIKIHNLPDHVYFNHAQHVSVGGIACQQCHGNVEEMDEVFQFAPLSMGWCVNCHRQTEVKFASNSYYDIYEKYHEEIKSGKRTAVTVEDIGGLECQKCHY